MYATDGGRFTKRLLIRSYQQFVQSHPILVIWFLSLDMTRIVQTYHLKITAFATTVDFQFHVLVSLFYWVSTTGWAELENAYALLESQNESLQKKAPWQQTADETSKLRPTHQFHELSSFPEALPVTRKASLYIFILGFPKMMVPNNHGFSY